MGFKCLIVLFAASFITLTSADKWKRLKKDVFDEHDPDVRPKCGPNTLTNVTLGVALRQILRLDAPSQEISINVWMRLRWTDCRLVWNESEYGLPHIQVPKNRIWIPDITVYDASSGESLPGINDFRAKVYSNGQVSYNWPSVVSIFCKLQVTKFPMDRQVCAFIFTSWTYNGGEIDWTPMFKTGDLSNFQANAEWDIVKYISEKHSAYYSCCPYPFVDLTFYLHMQRRPLHYVINLILPCVLISALTLLGFLMPVESGEKVSLQITVMLSLAVFLLVISDHLPPSADSMPLIGMYFAFTLALVTVSCVITVAVLHVHFKASNRVPTWIRKHVIEKFGKILLVEGLHKSEETEIPLLSSLQEKYSASSKTNENNNDHTDKTAISMNEQNGILLRILSHVEASPKNDNSSKFKGFRNDGVVIDGNLESQCDVGQYLREQSIYLRKIAAHFDGVDKDGEQRNEWRVLAIVIDRIFFVICLVFLVVTTVLLFVQLENKGS